MIENLNGIHETVNYKADTNLRLYTNDEFEDYPQHWHTPIEIIMPTTNEYYVTCNDHSFTLENNDILLICPGVIHSLSAPEVGVRIIFQAELSMLHSLKEFESIITMLYPALHITSNNFPEIHLVLEKLLLEIQSEYTNNLPLSELHIYAKLIEMFVLIGRTHKKNQIQFLLDSNKQKEYTDKFIHICQYISEHCSESLTLDEVAKKAGFSKYHFTRLFKQFTNISFYKFVNIKRISVAESLLINPEMSITDVCLQCGFTSISSFIRMFKLLRGCTPTEFRKLYTK